MQNQFINHPDFTDIEGMKLKTQIYLAVAVISTVLLLSLLYGASLLNRLESVRHTQARVAEFESEILQMRRHEKDFLARHDLKYVARFGNVLHNTQSSLNNLVSGSDGIISDSDLQPINEALATYQASFTQTVGQVKLIGLTASDGLLGQLNSNAKHLVRTLRRNKHVQLDLFKIRQHEKDFRLSKNLKYSKRLQVQVKDFMNDMKAVGHTPESPEVQVMNRYLDSFLAVVEAATTIGLSPDEGLYGDARAAAHALENQAGKLLQKVQTGITQRLNDIYMNMALVFGLIVIGIAATMTLLARRISARATVVSRTMDAVRQSGELGASLPSRGQDEFSIIGRSFNAMMAMIKDASQARDEALQEVQTAFDKNAELLRQMASLKFAIDQHAIVSFTDPEGTITYVNDKFCEVSQHTREELLGANHRIVKSGYHPASFFEEMWQTIQSGEVWKGEVLNHKKDGTSYWVAATIIPFLNEKGEPEQYAAIRTDITYRKEIEEAQRRSEQILRLVLDTIPVSVFWKDRESRYLGCNAHFAHDAQLDGPEQIIGKRDRDLVWADHADRYRKDDLEVMNGNASRVDHEVVGMNSEKEEKYWRQVTKLPLTSRSEEEAIGVFCCYADITERKQAEMERERLFNELKVLKRQLEVEATTDPLSSLLNRRGIEREMDREARRVSRRGSPFAIILCDIDHFKRVNDTHGHDLGDEVIKRVSRILTDICRASDAVARWGGEEFLMMLPETDTDGALVLAEKLRTAVETQTWPFEESVTMSFGIAVPDGNQPDIDATIQRADKCLYLAKNQGRNRVVTERKPASTV